MVWFLLSFLAIFGCLGAMLQCSKPRQACTRWSFLASGSSTGIFTPWSTPRAGRSLRRPTAATLERWCAVVLVVLNGMKITGCWIQVIRWLSKLSTSHGWCPIHGAGMCQSPSRNLSYSKHICRSTNTQFGLNTIKLHSWMTCYQSKWPVVAKAHLSTAAPDLVWGFRSRLFLVHDISRKLWKTCMKIIDIRKHPSFVRWSSWGTPWIWFSRWMTSMIVSTA